MAVMIKYPNPFLMHLRKLNMFSKAKTLSVVDPDLAKFVELERVRQDEHIELIASENYTALL
jgi:glycine/serine hydroxymethyltransferase